MHNKGNLLLYAGRRYQVSSCGSLVTYTLHRKLSGTSCICERRYSLQPHSSNVAQRSCAASTESSSPIYTTCQRATSSANAFYKVPYTHQAQAAPGRAHS